MIGLQKITPRDRERLKGFLQNYLHELSDFYSFEKTPAGEYKYKYFDHYFTEPEREAYFILSDGVTAGFVMLNRHSETGEPIDRAIAEFTVFPEFRRAGVGMEAARLILSSRPGRWELKYSERNHGAAAFWERLTRPYLPRVTPVGDGERVLSFTV